MPDDLSSRVREARLLKGWSQAELAKRAGVTQSTIDRIEQGTAKRSRYIAEVMSALDIASVAAVKPNQGYRPPPEFFGEVDLPVYVGAEGGPGEMVVSNDPIEIVVRPWFLRQVKDGFAILITGESMIPAFRPGEIAIVNPKLPPMRGADTIFTSLPEETGEFRATIKHLLSWTADKWRVEQFNPPDKQERELDLLRAVWPNALRVVGKYYRG